MPFLLIAAIFVGIIGMAFPPLLILSAFLGWRFVRLTRQRVAEIRAEEAEVAAAAYAKLAAAHQKRRDQAIRYFA